MRTLCCTTATDPIADHFSAVDRTYGLLRRQQFRAIHHGALQPCSCAMQNSLASLDQCEETRRAHQRTRMFVTAILSSAATTTNVRVRDMSESGAFIEADVLPLVGERVKLRKSELSATGIVVRREGNQAGLRFERPITVIDWLPNKARSQLMVDIAFETIKPRFEGGPPATNARGDSSALPSSPATRDELEGIAGAEV